MNPDEQIARHIEAHGWHCLHVGASNGDEDPFSYSIGFWQRFQAPEVMVFGLGESQSHALLAACLAQLEAGARFEPGVENDSLLGGGYKVVFKVVGEDRFPEYLGTAMRYYEDRPFPALVMFLPDREHRFAWDEGYVGPAAREALGLAD